MIDLMLDGWVCQQCGCLWELSENVGYPQTCHTCREELGLPAEEENLIVDNRNTDYPF